MLLTHARFEELCQDLFHSTLEPVEKVLWDSKAGMTVFNPSLLASDAVKTFILTNRVI